MIQIPNFAEVAFADPSNAATAAGEPWLTPEGIAVKGVYGARMTGGGFGGCIVALVQPAEAESLMAHLGTAYKVKYNIDPVVFATSATSGAGMME